MVSVPVLSNTMVSNLLKSLITSLPFNNTPCLAPFPIPATLDTGTPITRAPGHPKTSMVIANSISFEIKNTIIPRPRTAGV